MNDATAAPRACAYPRPFILPSQAPARAGGQRCRCEPPRTGRDGFETPCVQTRHTCTQTTLGPQSAPHAAATQRKAHTCGPSQLPQSSMCRSTAYYYLLCSLGAVLYCTHIRDTVIAESLVTRLRTGKNRYIFSDTFYARDSDTSAIHDTAIQRDTSYLMYHHPSANCLLPAAGSALAAASTVPPDTGLGSLGTRAR